MSGYESEGSTRRNRKARKKLIRSNSSPKNKSSSRSLVHDEELKDEIAIETKLEISEISEQITMTPIKKKQSFRSVVSKKASTIKHPRQIFKIHSEGELSLFHPNNHNNIKKSDNVLKSELISKKLSHASGITCTLNTETGDSSFNVSNPVLLFQTPTLSRMYTVSGAFRQGCFTKNFKVKKIPYPDGILRETAISGELVDIVEWCTYFPGSSVIKYLLLSFRICKSPLELFYAFVDLWKFYSNNNTQNDNFMERGYVFIVQWILLWGSIDFTNEIRDELIEFVSKIFADYLNGIAVKHIITLLNSPQVFKSPPGELMEIECIEDTMSTKMKMKKFARVMTLPLNMLSPRCNNFNVLDFDVEVICNHLTSLENDLFQAIQITELLNNNWLKDNKRQVAPNLTNLSDYFNKVSTWAATIVLSTSTGKKKVRVFHKFIRIIRKLMSMRNYSTACQIATGLNNFAISRLRMLQNNIPSKYYIRLTKYLTTLGPQKNYKRYRKLSLESPCIPLLPVHLRDIASIADNEPNFLDKEKQILNVDKLHSLSMQIYKLYNLKIGMLRFTFDSNLSIRDTLLTSIQAGLDSDSLYNASVTIQPISPKAPLQLRKSSSTGDLIDNFKDYEMEDFDTEDSTTSETPNTYDSNYDEFHFPELPPQ